MRCERCRTEAVFFAHDATAEAHHWEPGREEACECGVEPVCAVCEAGRIARDGFLLLPRPSFGVRGVASAVQVRH